MLKMPENNGYNYHFIIYEIYISITGAVSNLSNIRYLKKIVKLSFLMSC